jgi:organic hydroperoxide reductase OsmC/OhrA
MHPYPHVYTVAALGAPTESVSISSPGLPTLATNAPREFDGPGDQWSPENLLCAAVADCFILTFRAIARASKLEWLDLQCTVRGTLERMADGASFTRFETQAVLKVPLGADAARCRALLNKAEHSCLIANSLRAQRALEALVVTA